jgi:hypothetical protein
MNPNELCLVLEDYAIEELHEILQRAGLYLPARGGHWLTKKLMLAMCRGDIYCPNYAELIPKPCPRPPSRQSLVEELNKEIAKKFGGRAKCLKTTPTRMPELRWLLEALSALNSNHHFFHKGWQPDRMVDPYLEIKIGYLRKQIDLTCPLFKDLPFSLLIRRKSLKGMAPSQLQP